VLRNVSGAPCTPSLRYSAPKPGGSACDVAEPPTWGAPSYTVPSKASGERERA
jgi:hypothetical protein